MRRLVVIVPDWHGSEEEPSVLRQSLSSVERLAAHGEVIRLEPIPFGALPEAAYLGMDPVGIRLAQGPLTVAALGYDPPERSAHCHLSLLSLDSEGRIAPCAPLSPAEAAAVMGAAQALNTRKITILPGERVDHALVMEDASVEVELFEPESVMGQPLRSRLPNGDGEAALRRLIDDSVNLLSEWEGNARRADEGLPPANLLWPWGIGFRHPVPNLLLERGEPGWVESPSLRMQGLTRLAGWRHGELAAMAGETNLKLEGLQQRLAERPLSVAVLPALSRFRAAERWEEADWLTREIDSRLLAPIADDVAKGELRAAILSPSLSDRQGIALLCEKGAGLVANSPFDERTIEDRRGRIEQVWRVVDRAMRPPTPS